MIATVAVVSLVVVVAGVLLFMYWRSEHFSSPAPNTTHMLSENVKECIKGNQKACVTINTRHYGSTSKAANTGYAECQKKAKQVLANCNPNKLNTTTVANFMCAGQAMSGSLAKSGPA